MDNDKATVAGYTIGTLGGFAALAVIFTGFASCQRNTDNRTAEIGKACVERGGQWSSQNSYQCIPHS
jgi:hypothetical protein